MCDLSHQCRGGQSNGRQLVERGMEASPNHSVVSTVASWCVVFVVLVLVLVFWVWVWAWVVNVVVG